MDNPHTFVVSGGPEEVAQFAPLLALPDVHVELAARSDPATGPRFITGADRTTLLHHVVLVDHARARRFAASGYLGASDGFRLTHHVADSTLPEASDVSGAHPRVVLIEQRLVEQRRVDPRLVEPLGRLATPGCQKVDESLTAFEIKERFGSRERLMAPLAIPFAGPADPTEAARVLHDLWIALAPSGKPLHLVCRLETARALGGNAEEWHRLTVIRTIQDPPYRPARWPPPPRR